MEKSLFIVLMASRGGGGGKASIAPLYPKDNCLDCLPPPPGSRTFTIEHLLTYPVTVDLKIVYCATCPRVHCRKIGYIHIHLSLSFPIVYHVPKCLVVVAYHSNVYMCDQVRRKGTPSGILEEAGLVEQTISFQMIPSI